MDSTLSDLFGLFCHQWPDRSPQLDGAVFPLCYRCAGLYLGILASYLYLAWSGGWRRRLPQLKVVIGSSALIVPFLIDGWGNTLGLWSAPGSVRSLTGLAAGVVLPLLLIPLARPLDGRAAAPKATLPRLAALIWPLALSLFFITMVLEPVAVAAFDAAALAASAGLLLFLSNMVQAARTALGGVRRRGNGACRARPQSVRSTGAEVPRL